MVSFKHVDQMLYSMMDGAEAKQLLKVESLSYREQEQNTPEVADLIPADWQKMWGPSYKDVIFDILRHTKSGSSTLLPDFLKIFPRVVRKNIIILHRENQYGVRPALC
jgi:hypothetical protein